MNTIRTAVALGLVLLVVMVVGVIGAAHVQAQEQAPGVAEVQGGAEEAVAPANPASAEEHAAIFIAIAVAIAGSCLAAGYAVGKVGSAALGAVAEHPELMGRALIFVGLAEGIAIYGLIVAVMLIRKL